MKNEDVNWVRTNPWTAKYPSAEMGDMPRNSTAVPWLAARKLYGIRTEFPRNLSDFLCFL